MNWYKKAQSNWIYHNTKSEFLNDVKTTGLESDSFSTQPINLGGDIWLAVDKNSLPNRTQDQYGDVTEPEETFVISPDLIYLSDNTGKILGKLNEPQGPVENKTKENSIEDEARKYKTLKGFEKDYEILYHGGSENIIGDKLSLGGRVAGEVTEENLGKGQDYGGIFFTPEIEFAKTFSGHSPSGIGKVHTFIVKRNNLFSEKNANHRRLLENFIGKDYMDQDGETVEFTRQMYDFIFPKLEDGKRHMDWATFDPNILETIGFEGAKVIENYDAYGNNKHLYTTVLFTGGKESPHWKIQNDQTISDIYNNATKYAKSKLWYKKAQEKIAFENTHKDYWHGQNNYILLAKMYNEPVGGIEYSEYEGTLAIQNMLVKPEYRRQGIGTALVEELNRLNVSEFESKPIKWGMLTSEGYALKQSVESEKENELV